MNANYVFDRIANEIVIKSYLYKNNDTQMGTGYAHHIF